MKKSYLGDGCYVASDGFGLVITTTDGMRDTNTIYFEPEVYAALLRFVADLHPAEATPSESVDR